MITTTLTEIAKLVRKDILVSTFEAKSGHPTTCLSSVELLVVLFFKYLNFEPENYPQIYHDEFILSKGHAAPLLYSIYKRVGIINEDILSLRKLGSKLEGHPSVKLKGINYATGSLGQGLSIALGAAIARKIKGVSSKVYVLLGDGEFMEGSNYEALNLAVKYNLDNLCMILDVNKLGQSGQTMFGHTLEEYTKRLDSFGWNYVTIDGHDLQQISSAYEEFTNNKGKPFAIVAKTIKGKGISFLEDKEGWHGKPISKKEELEQALKELGDVREIDDYKVSYKKYHLTDNLVNVNLNEIEQLEKEIEDKEMATRQAVSIALTKLGKYFKNLVVLDADVKNSTYTHYFEELHSERFIQCYIAEQAMTGIALGLSKNGFIPYLSTFGAFFTRAFDFIRMMMYSKPNLVIFTGTHAGVSIGEDGPSQMALEDIAMFSSLIESTVLYPSDSISSQKLLFEVFRQYLEGKLKGIVYFRTSRPSTPKIYDKSEKFEIGKVKVLRSSDKDKVVVLSAGVPLVEALKAYEILSKEGINVRIVDVYSIKPLDEKYLISVLSGISRILVFEEHSVYGGIGQIISWVLSKNNYKMEFFESIGIDCIPGSAPAEELLKYHKLDYSSIYEKIKEIV
ncbi:MAG: transketolase [bacterium]